ncbi:hypothetical protein QR680_013343 [Steinernema hermaphroditum]|uniref:Uncharacterized protein n=1 Tax=Steinernema hermaphroditum TaxID=289476 RepID=A0AA39I572_9BILA|nr:hypothetical protein QR680_013343 [Steinernema hermaphroditum]
MELSGLSAFEFAFDDDEEYKEPCSSEAEEEDELKEFLFCEARLEECSEDEEAPSVSAFPVAASVLIFAFLHLLCDLC